MSNMSYCRFQNTRTDLRDCMDFICDGVSKDEHYARKRLIELCKDIVDQCFDEDGTPIGRWSNEWNAKDEDYEEEDEDEY